ncbi:hypothetical protein ANN_10002 [Periplaneta americana]|uniref:Uncharacterized protein n=1 Tax=Periplaneta americana TaxID=6978 RepID=A0ABQ8TQI7_PERAM|nr:hypothetical protein ANN_10002 [Periplaneta americana]
MAGLCESGNEPPGFLKQFRLFSIKIRFGQEIREKFFLEQSETGLFYVPQIYDIGLYFPPEENQAQEQATQKINLLESMVFLMLIVAAVCIAMATALPGGGGHGGGHDGGHGGGHDGGHGGAHGGGHDGGHGGHHGH